MSIPGLSYDNSSYERRSIARDELGIQKAVGVPQCTQVWGQSPQMQASLLLALVPDLLWLTLITAMKALRLCKEIAFWRAAGVRLALGFFVDPKYDRSNPTLILLSHLLEDPAAALWSNE